MAAASKKRAMIRINGRQDRCRPAQQVDSLGVCVRPVMPTSKPLMALTTALRAESMQGHADDHGDYRRQRHDQRCRFPPGRSHNDNQRAGTPPG